MALVNRVNKQELKEKIKNDPTLRKTISFYRYVIIENPSELRDSLFKSWQELGCLGRIYIANEGINAQMSVPEGNFQQFLTELYADPRFKDVPLKYAVEDDGKSFYRLQIKVRKKIVADGLDDNTFDVTNVGKHLSAKEFNDAMDLPGTIVVDMRNHYESEVGHFINAICPDVDTFKEELPWVAENLKDKKDSKVLLYCTGGVRCEKASAYLKHQGFKDVNQLHGGIIDYVRQIKEENIPAKFIGKNFVFDERRGENVTNDIISNCHTCGKPCNDHVNCNNAACHVLFIQCAECIQQLQGCCSEECKAIYQLPPEEQKLVRQKAGAKPVGALYSKGRLRPTPEIVIKRK